MCRFRCPPGIATICRSILGYAPFDEIRVEDCTADLGEENEIVGEALVALQHDDLKQMGIASVGHRLTILKAVYDLKVKQDIPIESDHYVPLCKSANYSKLLDILILYP